MEDPLLDREGLITSLQSLLDLGRAYAPLDCRERQWQCSGDSRLRVAVFEDVLNADWNGERILWPGALALSRAIEVDGRLRRKVGAAGRALELGAGCGLVSLVCAAMGCQRVFATEHPSMVPWLRTNVAHNPTLKKTVAVLPLDWTEVQRFTQPWTDPPEVIVGSDLTYDEDLHPDLVATLRRLSGPRTTILMAHDDASTPACPQLRKAFFGTALPEAGFRVRRVDAARLLNGTGFHSATIHLFEATKQPE
eukprot:EG_transcript_13762